MKKLLAVVLAAAIVLSLGVVSFAASNDAKPKATVTTYIKATDTETTTTVPIVADYDTANEVTDLVKPGSTVYVKVSNGLEDKDNFKVKFDKGDDNPKMIKKISIAEKSILGDPRNTVIKVELNDNTTDSEYKVSPSVTFTAKDKDVPSGADKFQAGDKITVELKFWIGNVVEGADQDYMAGDDGVVLKPTKNEDNEINWEDENNTIATLKFVGDDDGKYFYPKLSTKWEDADYAEYFADQDAFIFNFTGANGGNTKIASTSRATLELYNPYYDSDEDELTVEPENCVVYMVGDDGSINDVTASFKAVETDDGDYVFQTKTRELGIYIIAEKPYTTAAAEDVETPDDGKAIPDTGIWA